MSFERARSKENKEIRLNQIKEAAAKLFDEKNYHEISLSNIGKEINFTRANLYKYVSSKEDIFLYITIDEFNAFLENAKKALLKEAPLKTEDFCNGFARTLNEHQRFLRLLSLLFTIIELNANHETLIHFKNELNTITIAFFALFKHNLNDLSDEEIGKLMNTGFALIIGIYPISSPTKAQLEAAACSSYSFDLPSFEETLSDALIYMIKGLRLSKI